MGIVADNSGETARDVFWEMPLSLVYAWEHYHYRVNNVDTKRLGRDDGPIGGGAGMVLAELAKMEEDIDTVKENLEEIRRDG